MVGFTEEQLVELMNMQNIAKEEQEKLLPLMQANYDGYRFSINAKKYKKIKEIYSCGCGR